MTDNTTKNIKTYKKDNNNHPDFHIMNALFADIAASSRLLVNRDGHSVNYLVTHNDSYIVMTRYNQIDGRKVDVTFTFTNDGKLACKLIIHGSLTRTINEFFINCTINNVSADGIWSYIEDANIDRHDFFD